MGVAAGICVAIAFNASASSPNPPDQLTMLGPRDAIALMAGYVGGETTGVSLTLFFFYFLIRSLLRQMWVAVGVMLGVLMTFGWLANGFVGIGFSVFIGSLAMILLNRYGLLATAAMAFVDNTLRSTPMTTDLSEWFAPSMLTVLAVIIAIMLWSFRIALGGRKLLKTELLDA